MKRIARTVAILLAAFIVLALGLDAIVGISQPVLEPGAAEAVLSTFDADGERYETRLVVVEDGDTLWIQSGHHFRGWYDRMLLDPDVELVRNGEAHAYRAVPVDTPEAKARVVHLLKQRTGAVGFYLIRTFLLFAEIKPVRLDPR